MKFQVGKFTCELSFDDCGDVRAQWLPGRPQYLNREERAQYLARRWAFLELAHTGGSGKSRGGRHASARRRRSERLRLVGDHPKASSDTSPPRRLRLRLTRCPVINSLRD
jgi:hypothetical protein